MTLPIIGSRLWLRNWAEADLKPYEAWMQPGQRWQDFDGPYYWYTSSAPLRLS